MRKVREVLRLRHALSLSYREIGEALVRNRRNPQYFADRRFFAHPARYDCQSRPLRER